MKNLKLLTICLILVLLSCDNNDKTLQEPLSVDNEILMCNFDFINSQHNTTAKPNNTSKPGTAIIDWPRWKTGQTIKIKFLDGEIAWQESVKKIASQWTVYANLKFEYVGVNEYADIRIGFNAGNLHGVWSLEGAKSAFAPQSEQTMRLGSGKLKEEDFRRTILHEFGHALGLVHETTNPAANIQWNLPKTYKYYYDLRGWSKEQVDEIVINKKINTSYSAYDPLSIMQYYVDPKLTTNGIRVDAMKELSPTDKKSISNWYPYKSIINAGEITSLTLQEIRSPNCRYSLKFMAGSGSLLLIDVIDNSILWTIYAYNPNTYVNTSCFLLPDGNFAMKGQKRGELSQNIIWSSKTAGYNGATLSLQDNGNLLVLWEGMAVWNSKTAKKLNY